MSQAHSQLERLIARAQRRLLASDVVRRSGLWLSVSTAVALFLTLASRFLAAKAPWWLIAVVAGMGLPIACALAWRGRAAGLGAAVVLDDSLHLKDRLGTALSVESLTAIDHSNPMAQLVSDDAERLAARIDPRSAARIEWPLSLGLAALTALVCGLLLWLVEPRNLLARPDTLAEHAAVADARQQAAAGLRERAEQLRAGDESAAPVPELDESPARQRALETLDRLAKQFDAPPRDSPTDESTSATRARDAELSSAAREAIELADQLDREAQIEREAQSRAARRLAEMTPRESGGAADEFVESLRNGDLESAADWLESLEQRLRDAKPDERQRLAESLRETAKQLTPDAETDPTPSESASDPRNPADDLGLTPEQLDEWRTNPPSPDAIRRTLQQQGHDPIDAQELAEQLQRGLADEAAERQARERINETARRLSELAESIESPPDQDPAANEQQPAPPAESNEPPAPANDPNQPQATGGDQSTDRVNPNRPTDENAEQSGSDPPPRDPAAREGESDAEPKPDPEAESGQEQGRQRTPAEGGGGAPEPVQSPTPQPVATPQPDAESGEPGRQGEPTPRQDTNQPGAPGAREGVQRGGADERAAEESGDREGEPAAGPARDEAAPSPGTENPAPGEPGARVTPPSQEEVPPGSVAERVRRLRETLDELDKQDRPGGAQEISQEMRDAAQELLEQMSHEERREIERWVAEQDRENGEGAPGPGGSPRSLLNRTLPTQPVENPRLFEYETQDVNAGPAGEAVDDRVIAEMYSSEQDRPEGAVDRQPMDPRRSRQAAQAIERALNEEAIPPRYRTLIRNWARRVSESAASGGAEPSPAKP